MANVEYSTTSSSSVTGDNAGNLFHQVDANKDGAIDRAEFSNFFSNAAGGAGFGGVAGGSYESSFSSGQAAGGALDAALAGASFGGAGGASFGGASGASFGGSGGASYFESSSGFGADAALGGASFQTTTLESAGAGGAIDAAAVGQVINYPAEVLTAWSKYGAEVRGAGLYVDANPQIIRKQAPGGVQTYTQNIKVRFLQPPQVPPPGPLIIKEVRPPQPPPPPPLRIRQQAPPLPQPAPLILREKPPQPPAAVASQTVIRKLAALPVPPRSVIIERIPAAPAPPRDIIIERWIPYGAAAKRKTVVQRAEAAKAYAAPRNVIIQYEPVQVRVVRQFQRLGVVQENPSLYVQRWGVQLLDAQTLLQQARAAGVVEDISPPAVAGLVGAAGAAGATVSAGAASFAQDASFGAAGAGGVGGGEFVSVAGGDLGGASSSFSSSTFESSTLGGAGGLGGASFEGGYGGEFGGAGASYSTSGFESSSYTTGATSGGAGGAGFDFASATFNLADANKDGKLDSAEFSKLVQSASS